MAEPLHSPESNRKTPPATNDLPPPDVYDPVIEHYKKDIDRTLLRENLRLTPDERLRKFEAFLRSLDRWKGAGQRAGMPHDDGGEG